MNKLQLAAKTAAAFNELVNEFYKGSLQDYDPFEKTEEPDYISHTLLGCDYSDLNFWSKLAELIFDNYVIGVLYYGDTAPHFWTRFNNALEKITGSILTR